ncbi:MAG: hypothetical protein OEW73_10490 [Gammaproteobacteria bacterium]|nr:hypothetical protein [Gammaproteobacteria bacterium]MDH5241199.1 hypothetical protein [Gammaproteobacteria bacterium]MDH5260775.1 hypothetical protein [Gammaproteobacteria bacterium]MDH5583267.1 hypothetical protein [Gammaproteobacteria bacterium]
MLFTSALRKTLLILTLALAVLLGACASGAKLVTVLPVTESADTPYDNILVIGLFKSYDARRYFEKEVVDRLKGMGVEAVASSSMMNSKTPVTRETFLAMVDKVGADSVLVSRVITLESDAKMLESNTLFKRNFYSTYYYNLYEVTMSEYEEPKTIEFNHSVRLATQLVSVSSKEPVWAIESSAEVFQNINQDRLYAVYVDEAKAITGAMSRDGLLAR